MIKGVIFDMDGVLVDNSMIHIESFAIFCQKHNIDLDKDQLLTLFGMGNEEIMPRIFGRELTLAEIDRFSEEKEEIYREIIAEKIEPLAGLKNILIALKERGIKVAVGSSGMAKNVNFVLEKCGITQYFDQIANGDMVERAKPDPAIFLMACKLLDLDPAECLVFEDSFAGIEAARSAGCKVVAVATTYARNLHTDYDMIIDDFTQITIDQITNLQIKN